MMRYRKTPAGAVASYAPPEQGPFVCSNCEYEARGQCIKPEVVKEFQMLRGLSRVAKSAPIAASGCCNFHELR